MELARLIVQAVVLCTALLAVTCGLMWAPWYLLLAALGLVLVSFRHFMPDSRDATPNLDESIAPAHAEIAQQASPGEDSPNPLTDLLPASPHSTHLIYRGSDYVLSQDPKGHSV